MQRRTYTLARLLALLLLGALCASWGWRAGLAKANQAPDYSSYSSAQMSWIIEGIWERAGAEAERAARIQQDKMAEEGLLPTE